MAFNLLNSKFSTNIIPQQEDNLPFIGDLVTSDDEYSEVSKTFSVLSFDIHEDSFTGCVALSTFDEKDYKSGYDNVIIAVEILIDNQIRGVWKVQIPPNLPTTSVPFNHALMQDQAMVLSYKCISFVKFICLLNDGCFKQQSYAFLISSESRLLQSQKSLDNLKTLPTVNVSYLEKAESALQKMKKEISKVSRDALGEIYYQKTWLRTSIIFLRHYQIRVKPLLREVEGFIKSTLAVKKIPKTDQLVKSEAKNIVKCLKRRPLTSPVTKLGKLIIPCSLSKPNGKCSSAPREWICQQCQDCIFYNFKGKCICKCGEADIRAVTFHCSDLMHGPHFVALSNYDWLANLKPIKEKNILILGEPDVGKSTWINAVANYLIHKDFEMALNEEMLFPIPTTISVVDYKFNTHTLHFGEDDDDDSEIGNLVTKKCKTYRIKWSDFFINFIDTPGIGYTDNPEQDKENFNLILDYIGYVNELHGICILLKPNQSEITSIFEYCVKGLLANLHENCANNMVFCFTRARETFYRPGTTYNILKRLLDDSQIQLSLNNRIFHMDNESFTYLCCKKTKFHRLYESDTDNITSSWNHSKKEANKLLDFLIRQKPHFSKDLLTVNHARKLIYTLIKPLAEVVKTIQMNIEVINNHKVSILTDDCLPDKYAFPLIRLVFNNLQHPKAVCSSSKCIKYEFMPYDLHKIVYKQLCHSQCYCSDQFNKPKLQKCTAMIDENQCKSCGCSWQKHLHIMYEQNYIDDHIEIKNQKQFDNDILDRKRKFIQQLEQQASNLEEEKTKIVSIAAAFAHFLNKYAIIATNDIFEEYFDFLINLENEKLHLTLTEKRIVHELEKTKRLYISKKELFENTTSHSQKIEIEDITAMTKKLHDLPIFGKQIQELVNVVESAEQRAVRSRIKSVEVSKFNTLINDLSNLSVNSGGSTNIFKEQSYRGFGKREGGHYHNKQ